MTKQKITILCYVAMASVAIVALVLYLLKGWPQGMELTPMLTYCQMAIRILPIAGIPLLLKMVRPEKFPAYDKYLTLCVLRMSLFALLAIGDLVFGFLWGDESAVYLAAIVFIAMFFGFPQPAKES